MNTRNLICIRLQSNEPGDQLGQVFLVFTPAGAPPGSLLQLQISGPHPAKESESGASNLGFNLQVSLERTEVKGIGEQTL